METQALIEEIRKLPPDQKLVVRDFILRLLEDVPPQNTGKSTKPSADTSSTRHRLTLHQMLSRSPFADLEFDPEGIRAPVRPVAL